MIWRACSVSDSVDTKESMKWLETCGLSKQRSTWLSNQEGWFIDCSLYDELHLSQLIIHWLSCLNEVSSAVFGVIWLCCEMTGIVNKSIYGSHNFLLLLIWIRRQLSIMHARKMKIFSENLLLLYNWNHCFYTELWHTHLHFVASWITLFHKEWWKTLT